MMFATSNSRWALALWLAVAAPAAAQTDATPHSPTVAAHAEQNFRAARERFHNQATNNEAGWQFARACFDRAEFATNNTERAMLAVEGISAARDVAARAPKLAAGHYYLAMNLGQLARTKMLGALKLVGEMECEFKTAHDLDEHLDFAGPDRNLGQLYFQAPGWPTSIGSHHKAREHLEHAVELAPEYPENHLDLLEACLKWNDKKGVQRELKAVGELWPAARASFTGEKWESIWADWEARRARLTKEAQKIAAPRPR